MAAVRNDQQTVQSARLDIVAANHELQQEATGPGFVVLGGFLGLFAEIGAGLAVYGIAVNVGDYRRG